MAIGAEGLCITGRELHLGINPFENVHLKSWHFRIEGGADG